MNYLFLILIVIVMGMIYIHYYLCDLSMKKTLKQVEDETKKSLDQQIPLIINKIKEKSIV